MKHEFFHCLQQASETGIKAKFCTAASITCLKNRGQYPKFKSMNISFTDVCQIVVYFLTPRLYLEKHAKPYSLISFFYSTGKEFWKVVPLKQYSVWRQNIFLSLETHIFKLLLKSFHSGGFKSYLFPCFCCMYH